MHSTINFLGVKKYIFGVFIILLLSSCGKIPTTNEVTQTQTAEAEIVTETTQEPQEKVLVATSIVPISSLVHSIGGNFIEVENIVPLAVKTDEEGMKYVNYNNLAPILIEAVKELNSTIEKQSEEIKELKKLLNIKS